MTGPRWRDEPSVLESVANLLMLLAVAATLGFLLALFADPVGLVRWLASWGLPLGVR